ncbi:MAG: hypothetical protein AAGD86_09395 [Pseudomonadota bacterium]
MNSSHYAIREAHVQAALANATAAQVGALQALLAMVRELEDLERTLPERCGQARRAAGIEVPALSKAARYAVAQSDDARRDYDRLLTRRCNRATTAQAVVRELLDTAQNDLELTQMLDDGNPDDPVNALIGDLCENKRRFVERLRAFLD